ncbi:hypothetical protein CEH05_20545 (plasmid) [Halobacillus halophilus]|nr:hypothetical protein CEH05_20545 [Halobacillus halophilus]
MEILWFILESWSTLVDTLQLLLDIGEKLVLVVTLLGKRNVHSDDGQDNSKTKHDRKIKQDSKNLK